jgi:hypothetical protein
MLPPLTRGVGASNVKERAIGVYGESDETSAEGAHPMSVSVPLSITAEESGARSPPVRRASLTCPTCYDEEEVHVLFGILGITAAAVAAAAAAATGAGATAVAVAAATAPSTDLPGFACKHRMCMSCVAVGVSRGGCPVCHIGTSSVLAVGVSAVSQSVSEASRVGLRRCVLCAVVRRRTPQLAPYPIQRGCSTVTHEGN